MENRVTCRIAGIYLTLLSFSSRWFQFFRPAWTWKCSKFSVYCVCWGHWECSSAISDWRFKLCLYWTRYQESQTYLQSQHYYWCSLESKGSTFLPASCFTAAWKIYQSRCRRKSYRSGTATIMAESGLATTQTLTMWPTLWSQCSLWWRQKAGIRWCGSQLTRHRSIRCPRGTTTPCTSSSLSSSWSLASYSSLIYSSVSSWIGSILRKKNSLTTMSWLKFNFNTWKWWRTATWSSRRSWTRSLETSAETFARM